MAKSDESRAEVLQLIVEEVDQARDMLQLIDQLAPALPINSLDDLRKVGGGTIRFRDVDIDVADFADRIPALAFPIVDIRGLVARVGYLVRLVPPHLGVDMTSPEGARRQMRASSPLGLDLPVARTSAGTALVGVRPGASPTEMSNPLRRSES